MAMFLQLQNALRFADKDALFGGAMVVQFHRQSVWWVLLVHSHCVRKVCFKTAAPFVFCSSCCHCSWCVKIIVVCCFALSFCDILWLTGPEAGTFCPDRQNFTTFHTRLAKFHVHHKMWWALRTKRVDDLRIGTSCSYVFYPAQKWDHSGSLNLT